MKISDVRNCFKDAFETGAAVLGVRVTNTIKVVNDDMKVHKSLQRSTLWEIQTPQVQQLHYLNVFKCN